MCLFHAPALAHFSLLSPLVHFSVRHFLFDSRYAFIGYISLCINHGRGLHQYLTTFGPMVQVMQYFPP